MTKHTEIHGNPVLPDMISLAGFRHVELLDIHEFVGPFTGKIGDVPYVTFTQYGIKDEGESAYPDEETRCWTAAEAMWRFRKAFIAYLVEHPARQIAWRCKPTVEQSLDGDYIVRTRFALLGKRETPLQAVA